MCHEINIFSNTLSTPSYAIVSKAFISFFTAFTLAEVLIVLGIIGLIADMTIPTLVQNTQAKVASVRLQKDYAILEQAYRLAVSEYGTPDDWDLKGYIDKEGSMNVLNKFVPYLKTLKICGFESGCFAQEDYKKLDGSNESNYSTGERFANLLLADGTAVGFVAVSTDCSEQCFGINIDINGQKKPNQFGIDMFSFRGTKNGLVTNGLKDSKFDADTHCKKNSSGYGCAAWVIYNGNMDYLKCNDLSWDGKKKCK